MPRMIACKACGEAISAKAQSCPKCGHPARGVGQKPVSGCAVVLLILLGLFIWGLWSGPSSDTAPTTTRLPDAQCAMKLSCAGDRYMGDAAAPCKREIERRALHAVKWTDGLLTPTFSGFEWANASAHTIRYIGDRVEFQNGFGAMTPVTYVCDFDPASGAVLKVVVTEGRL